MGKHLIPDIKGVICITACLPLLSACSGIGGVSGDMPLKVTTEPSGARIYIMGKAIGETPATISQQQLYPTGYDAGNQQMYGTLLIKKAGCQDLKKRIHYQDFNTGLSVKLNCSGTPNISAEQAMPPAAATTHPTTSQQESATAVKSSDSPQNHEPPAGFSPTQQDLPETEKADANKVPIENSIKQRLIRIDNLRQEGLITEEEYRQARKRILGAL
ncbi:MAG: PEGA domain-containing protein [Candidatus Thiodiazotropha sp.]